MTSSARREQPERYRYLAPLAAAGTGVLVGSAIVATRYVIGQTDPASLALLRYLLGVVLLLPPVLMSTRVRFARRDLLPVALLGIGQFGILIALLNFGLQYIASGLGALIFATFPLLTLVLAALLRAEAMTLAKLAGVVLTILGVACALGEQLFLPELDAELWIGAGAVFASAFTGALCSVFYRPYVARYPPLQVGAFAMFASVLFLAALAAGEGFFDEVPEFTLGGWLAILFIGGNSALGYYLWLWALRHTTPTKVAVFLSLGPVTATVLGAVLLGETVSGLFLAGLACVALGLAVAHRPG
ncbi:MAG: DMT family transporter [Kiloniellales bacterium]|nr:DMT family transporter [Kiloniellales bacterium]